LDDDELARKWGLVDFIRTGLLRGPGDQAGNVQAMTCSKCGSEGKALTFANLERAGVVFHCSNCGEQELHELDEEA